MAKYLIVVKSLLGSFKKWEAVHISRSKNARADTYGWRIQVGDQQIWNTKNEGLRLNLNDLEEVKERAQSTSLDPPAEEASGHVQQLQHKRWHGLFCLLRFDSLMWPHVSQYAIIEMHGILVETTHKSLVDGVSNSSQDDAWYFGWGNVWNSIQTQLLGPINSWPKNWGQLLYQKIWLLGPCLLSPIKRPRTLPWVPNTGPRPKSVSSHK